MSYDLKKGNAFLVSVKGLIARDNKILILRCPPGNNDWNEHWGLPGGLLEWDEEIEKCLPREILEETGLKVSTGSVTSIADVYYDGFVVKDGRTLSVRIVQVGYLCKPESEEVTLSNEHDMYKWATKEDTEAMPLTRDSKKLIQDYFRQTQHK